MSADTAGWTFGLSEPTTTDRGILGGKGAGLVEMVTLGLPVPGGFVIGTPCGREHRAGGALPTTARAEIEGRIAALELEAGRRFGDDADPLLVSVRSGAPVSMPGMMDTILNVGLTPAAAARMPDARFAYSSLERLLDGFARTVRGVGAGSIEESLLDLPTGSGAMGRCEALLALIERESGAPFPGPDGQLFEAIDAVFGSWDSRRAKAYRRHNGIDDEMGTAVVVQLMVFGNRDDRSGSGVGFTRDPSTGAAGAFGDFLFEAQGEDVVSGEHDTEPLSVIADRLPRVHEELLDVFALLERDARDLCDVEFTIESGKLHVLQTRVGQRSGRAAVRLAVELCDAGTIDRAEALARVSDEHLESARAPVFTNEPAEDRILARGLAASPGAAVGVAAFDPGRAQTLADDGSQVVLVRPTTSPADLPGVIASTGVVTGRGGRTSHAAVVARGMGRAAVCGVGEVRISPGGRSARINGIEVAEGEFLSVDGDRGIVTRGERDRTPAEDDDTLRRFLGWVAEA